MCPPKGGSTKHNLIKLCHVEKHKATKSHRHHEQLALRAKSPPSVANLSDDLGDLFFADAADFDWGQTETMTANVFADKDIYQALMETVEPYSEQLLTTPRLSTSENLELELPDDLGEGAASDAEPEVESEVAKGSAADPLDRTLENLHDIRHGSGSVQSPYSPWPSHAVSIYVLKLKLLAKVIYVMPQCGNTVGCNTRD